MHPTWRAESGGLQRGGRWGLAGGRRYGGYAAAAAGGRRAFSSSVLNRTGAGAAWPGERGRGGYTGNPLEGSGPGAEHHRHRSTPAQLGDLPSCRPVCPDLPPPTPLPPAPASCFPLLSAQEPHSSAPPSSRLLHTAFFKAPHPRSPVISISFTSVPEGATLPNPDHMAPHLKTLLGDLQYTLAQNEHSSPSGSGRSPVSSSTIFKMLKTPGFSTSLHTSGP